MGDEQQAMDDGQQAMNDDDGQRAMDKLMIDN
jgi:hypothetical protein